MSYFILYSSGCDSTWSIHGPMPAEGVLRYMQSWKDDELDVEFLDKIPDIEFGRTRPVVVLIKGKAIIPRAVKVVEKYELP